MTNQKQYQLEQILKKVQDGTLSIEEAKKQLVTYEELGFAKIDLHRKQRKGFPEVIYGEGKTVEQILPIIKVYRKLELPLLITRVSNEKADLIRKHFPDVTYHEIARLLYWKKEADDSRTGDVDSFIAVICAGTSDLPVAEEAAVTAEVMGSRVKRFYDVGVSGIHRLLDCIHEIRQATVTVVVSGMEGALPSVVAGLVSHPVIAVPTSVGYGANLQGIATLLSMLNACASGISVVNIDNGFGGAFNAVLIDRIAHNAAEKYME